MLFVLQFTYFDTFSFYFFQTFSSLMTGNTIQFVVNIPSNINQSLYTLLNIGLFVFGVSIGLLLFKYLLLKKEQSLSAICLFTIVIVIIQIVIINTTSIITTGVYSVIAPSAFLSGLKYVWCCKYAMGFVTFAQTNNIMKLLTNLIDNDVFSKSYNNKNVKNNTEVFMLISILVSFISGCFLSLLLCYYCSYNAISLIILFNIIELLFFGCLHFYIKTRK